MIQGFWWVLGADYSLIGTQIPEGCWVGLGSQAELNAGTSGK